MLQKTFRERVELDILDSGTTFIVENTLHWRPVWCSGIMLGLNLSILNLDSIIDLTR